MLRSLIRVSVLALVTTTAALSPAQNLAPATSPTTLPALTPEQQKLLESLRNHPADEPLLRYSTKPIINGKPNPDLGKPDPIFQQKFESHLKRRQQPMDLLFIGDSITEAWSRAPQVWREHYAPLSAANFGIAGDRTEHVLWRIDHGELDGIHPKVVVLMIGTNNVARHSAQQIASGITKIVQQIHTRLPESKLLLLGVFPRGAKATSADRAKLAEVNKLIAPLADGKQTRYLEIWKEFLADDGSIPEEIMPDALHPSPKGYQIWADTMQPVLDELLKP